MRDDFLQPTYVYQTAPSCTLDPSPYPPPPTPLFALVRHIFISNAAYAAECWNDTALYNILEHTLQYIV